MGPAKRVFSTGVVLALLGSMVPLPAAPDEPVAFTEKEKRRILALSPLGPPPPDPTNRVADDPGAQHLGRFLFFDERLSGGHGVSCATCHDPARGFGDGKTVPETISRLDRHSMSLWNVAYNRWFFWDGRADSLWSQAIQPIEDPREMGGSRLQVAHLIAGDPELRRGYESVFGALGDFSDRSRFPPRGRPVPGPGDAAERIAWQSMSRDDRRQVDGVLVNVAKAIAAYERRLVSRDAPFDRFVNDLRAGKPSTAISQSARRGAKLYVGKANCRLCHNGPTFSDGEFHNNGVPPLDGGYPRDPARFKGAEQLRKNLFNSAGRHSDAPQGESARRLRSLVNGPEQWGAFKTPGLRNVALGPPFMHQGQLGTLRDVIRFYSTLEEQTGMGHHQETVLVPLNLTDPEIDDLVAFLESLTEVAIDAELLAAPASPIYSAPTD